MGAIFGLDYLDMITNRYGIGGTNATNTEIAFDMAIRHGTIGEIYSVACACGFDYKSSHCIKKLL